MTRYLDRRLKGVIVPSDREQPIEVMEGPLKELLEKVGWKYFSIVRTPYGRDNDFIMLVDEDGQQNDLMYNPRAQYLSGYPLQHPILGNTLFLSERMTDEGGDLFDISSKGQHYTQDPIKWSSDEGFKLWLAMNKETVEYYRGRWPGTENPCEGHAGDTDAELLSGAPMGETTYCDGSCKK